MTVMDAALRESLKALRLSGMLETLDARLAQAHGGELGHLGFLQALCQDEITRRETVALQRRSHRAKFEQQGTLEEFDFTASSKLPAALIRGLGALRWLHAGESVILFGPVGVGKTHIAQALGHLAVRQRRSTRWRPWPGSTCRTPTGLPSRTCRSSLQVVARFRHTFGRAAPLSVARLHELVDALTATLVDADPVHRPPVAGGDHPAVASFGDEKRRPSR